MVCLVGVKGGRCEVRVRNGVTANGKMVFGLLPWERQYKQFRHVFFGIFYKNVTLVSRDLNTSAYFTQAHTLQFSPSHPSSTPPLDSILNRNPTNPPSPDPNSRPRLPPGPPYRLPPAAQRSPSNPPQRPVPALGKSRHGQETAAQGRQQFCRRDSARRRVVPQPRQVPRPSRRARAALLEPAVALAVANALVLSRPQDVNNHHPDPPQSRQ